MCWGQTHAFSTRQAELEQKKHQFKQNPITYRKHRQSCLWLLRTFLAGCSLVVQGLVQSVAKPLPRAQEHCCCWRCSEEYKIVPASQTRRASSAGTPAHLLILMMHSGTVQRNTHICSGTARFLSYLCTFIHSFSQQGQLTADTSLGNECREPLHHLLLCHTVPMPLKTRLLLWAA